MKRSELFLSGEQKKYIEAHIRELEELVLRLARIPAPTGKEEKRAQFCLNWLHENGAEDAYIDAAGNVVYLYHDTKTEKSKTTDTSVIVYMAHMDVVFSDETELPMTERDNRIYCPGVGDDTANLAVLLMAAKYVAQYRPDTNGYTLLFVCDVGEEGFGNLKGVREICGKFHQVPNGNGLQRDDALSYVSRSRISRLYAFDLGYDTYTCRAVGSLRYRIQAKTKGGHSYGDFGNTSAIAVLAELIQQLYELPVPQRGKTTYNVGTISGGTSVNTIAQQAEMLYEIRSDDAEDLEEMRRKFEYIVEVCRKKYDISKSTAAAKQTAEVMVEIIGERPCEAGVDEKKRKLLFEQVEQVVEAVTGCRPMPVPCSTDCNIPLSMGIPSVCVGTCLGAGYHTREEYIEKSSLKSGFTIGLALVCGSWHF